MSRAATKSPAVQPWTARQIDKAADEFLAAHDDQLHERVAKAASKGITTTAKKLLKNDRMRDSHGQGIALPPRDGRAQVKGFDDNHADQIVKIVDANLAKRFQEKAEDREDDKKWGDADWLEGEGSGYGRNPAELLEYAQEYAAPGGEAGARALERAEDEEKARLEKEALSLIHPRDRERVRQFLAGVPVAEIAADEDVPVQTIYAALARSEQRIAALLEYRRQCKIWAMSGERGDRPDLPEIDDGATAEQLDLFGMSDVEVRK
jgi:hypothetical protein